MANLKNILPGIVILLLSFALYFSAQYNSFNVVLNDVHVNYQRESESLVLSEVYAEKNKIPTLGWHLGYIAPVETGIPDILYPYLNFGKNNNGDVKFIPYVSQVGIQSLLFKELGDWFNVYEVENLKKINSILFVFTIFILSVLYVRLFNPWFAIIFLTTFVFSPWVVPIARNLYWVPFTWFLPAIFSSFYFLSVKKSMKYFSLIMIFLSFAFKCMAGYEFISSITLLTAAPVFLSPFFNKTIRSYNFKDFYLVFFTCVIAFVVVLLIHSGMRGSSILEGLRNIYEYDVKRRTYGDAQSFSNVEIQKSLNATVWYVVSMYTAGWSTDIVKFVSGGTFPWLTSFVLILCIVNRSWKGLIAFVYVLSIPLSWYVLAKGHSEVHVFINFVLWYMLFIPFVFYYIGCFAVKLVSMYRPHTYK